MACSRGAHRCSIVLQIGSYQYTMITMTPLISTHTQSNYSLLYSEGGPVPEARVMAVSGTHGTAQVCGKLRLRNEISASDRVLRCSGCPRRVAASGRSGENTSIKERGTMTESKFLGHGFCRRLAFERKRQRRDQRCRER